MNNDVVKFTIGDDPQVYSLAYDYNAMCAAETDTGVNILAVSEGGNVSAIGVRALLYSLLKVHHPLVTLLEAGNLMTQDRDGVSRAMGLAMKLGTQDVEPESDAAAESDPALAPEPSV